MDKNGYYNESLLCAGYILSKPSILIDFTVKQHWIIIIAILQMRKLEHRDIM